MTKKPYIKTFLYFSILISCLCLYFLFLLKPAVPSSSALFEYNHISEMPIMHEGRVKPFDSYAKIVLKSINGQATFDGLSATQWLMQLMLNPRENYNQAVFHINNNELKQTLNLNQINHLSRRYFSFTELLPGIKQNINLISSLESKAKNKDMKLGTDEQLLLQLYHNSLLYFDLSRSLSLFFPEFDLSSLDQSFHIKLDANNFYKNNLIFHDQINYYQLLPYKNQLIDKIDEYFVNQQNNESTQQEPWLLIAKKFKDISNDKININLKLIPHFDFQNKDDNWLAPWEVLNGAGSPLTAQYLNLWQGVIYSYYNKDYITWNKLTSELKDLGIENIPSYSLNKTNYKLKIEKFYTDYNFFNKAMILYCVTFILCLIVLKINNSIIQSNQKNKISILCSFLMRFSVFLFLIAISCHIASIVMRMFILQRPPVTNLYESMLFVSLIIAIIAFILEIFRKDILAILLSSFICMILLFIANSYVQVGDSLGVTIAVLNNNFWLGTHVIAITSGYSCCLLLSAFAHIYLLKYCLSPKSFNILNSSLNKYITALALLSLFFTLLGTILGGIWADQSWGRFWGWDPKENGALLICLWLITLLHGKISGSLNNLKFIVGCALTSVTVAIAWFGVNLLSTGLHSYGFTENIATNLILFISFEILLITGLYIMIMKKNLHHF